MILVRDGFKLAYTKIRTRKIRLAITLIVASLLFAVLAASSLIFDGFMSSFESFSRAGFGNRYLIAGSYSDTSMFSETGMRHDPAVISRAEALYKADQDAKKAAAKRLNISYQPNEADHPAPTNPDGEKTLNYTTPTAIQALREAQQDVESKTNRDGFAAQLGNNADAYYSILRQPMQGFISQLPRLTVLTDGKEEYEQSRDNYQPPGFGKGLSAMPSSWTLMDRELITPFVLPGQNLERGSDGSIPIVISYSAAQEILKLNELKQDSTNQQKKERLSTVRSQIAGKLFSVCYRNYVSAQQLQEAVGQQADLKQNGSKKEYKKPDLLYGLPSEACGAPVIERDVRTAGDKAYAARQAQFDTEFGRADPKSQVLTFRVVGISPDKSLPTGLFNIQEILSLALSSTLGTSWVSPMETKEQEPVVADVFTLLPSALQFQPQHYYVAEYSNGTVARKVFKERSCIIQYPGMPTLPDQVPCSLAARPFMLEPFGSASLVIDDIKAGFRKVQFIASLVIAAIASIILVGMIGRIIADSRRETAIFRAIGASRLAVAQIYMTYTLYLILLISGIALLLGFGAALWVDSQLSSEMGVTMSLLFNTADLSKQFHFYHLNLYDVGLLTAIVAIAAFVGASIPIAHNMRRNPINDMRDE